jgi:hypothetical protein
MILYYYISPLISYIVDNYEKKLINSSDASINNFNNNDYNNNRIVWIF